DRDAQAPASWGRAPAGGPGACGARVRSTGLRFEPHPASPCFGCGGANPCGLKLAFDADMEGRRIIGRFRLGAEFQGGAGFIHGGIIATVLDEAMGKVCRFSDARAVTAELT